MKKGSTLFFLPIFCLVLASCKKNSGSNHNTGPDPGNLIRIQQGTGVADTVYLLTYDAQNRIGSIIDSVMHDTLVATYFGPNLLVGISEHSNTVQDKASFAYNTDGQLMQVDYTIGGEHDRVNFDYTAGILSSRKWSSDNGYGRSVVAEEADSITFSGSNITDIKNYSLNGGAVTFLQEEKMTYGSQPNTFKRLALFNPGNLLGMADILGLGLTAYFCDNVVSSITAYSNTHFAYLLINSVSQFDIAQYPSSIVTTENNVGTHTQKVNNWNFSYQ